MERLEADHASGKEQKSIRQEENAEAGNIMRMDKLKITDGNRYTETVKKLITDYTSALGRDLSFQHLDEELDDLAGKYMAPNGELLVAVDGDKVLGMVAYHRLNDSRCEMKRLYVVPESRGLHLGDKLIAAITEHAAVAGYSELVLDTIKPLKAAIYLYHKHGFIECEPYYHNPMDDVIYMRKEL